jgi:hypothetical protein
MATPKRSRSEALKQARHSHPARPLFCAEIGRDTQNARSHPLNAHCGRPAPDGLVPGWMKNRWFSKKAVGHQILIYEAKTVRIRVWKNGGMPGRVNKFGVVPDEHPELAAL